MIDLTRNSFIGVPAPEEIDAINGVIACSSTTTSGKEMCDCEEEPILRGAVYISWPTLTWCINLMDCHSSVGFSESLYTSTHTCMHTYIHMLIHVYACIYTYTHIYPNIHTFTYMHTHTQSTHTHPFVLLALLLNKQLTIFKIFGHFYVFNKEQLYIVSFLFFSAVPS